MQTLQIPVNVSVELTNKPSVEDIASTLKGIGTEILRRVLEVLDQQVVNSLCGEAYGQNEFHRHDHTDRTVVTQLGTTEFNVTRLKDKHTNDTFYPLYHVVDFSDGRRYQRDVAGISVDHALSMSYRDSKCRLERTLNCPSHTTIWRRVQELGKEVKPNSLEHDGYVSADGTKLHANPRSGCKKKLDVKVVAGENVVLGANERYSELADTDCLVVGDADRELECFDDRQIDVIHVPTEVNFKLWNHGVNLDTRKDYMNEVKKVLLWLKNSVGMPDLKERVDKVSKRIREFIKEMDQNGYWRVANFFTKYGRNILLFAYMKLKGIEIPWHNNWMERLMGEISKRMKNKWMSWSPKGAENLLNLLLKRYVENSSYEALIQKLTGKSYRMEVKFHI